MMDLSHDPHRGGLDDLHLASQELRPELSGSQRLDAAADSAGAESSLAAGQQQQQHRYQPLSYSWLLVLFVAPVIIVLLVCLLVLLRRRLVQSRHLVSSFGCSEALIEDSRENLEQSSSLRASHEHNQRQQSQRRPSSSPCKTSSSKLKSQRPTNAHYLLECSSSGSSTSSSNCTSTSTGGCSPPLSGSGRQQDAATTTSTISAQTSDCCQAMPAWQRRQFDRSAETMRSLLDHMGLFLLTLTCQEIFGCLVALTIAILNVIRMRNLFCCNLVIFALITSRLLNLLTLTTFSLTKLIKLFKLQVTCSPLTTAALTISPISSPSREAAILVGAEMARKKACQKRACQLEQASRGSREPVACRLLLLLLLSAFLALVFLYLRLSPPRGSLIVFNGDQGAPNRNRSALNADWSIAIYPSSTTTEASTRYTSGPDEQAAPRLAGSGLSESPADKASQQQQPNYLASWSARFQQSSSLRHLLDQYELQNFLNLLLDTHLQTSRFTCTLAASNYAPVAKVAMLAIYAVLMIAIVIAGMAIQRVGRKRLNQFKLHKLTAFEWPLELHQQPISSTLAAAAAAIREPTSTNSNRKRYTDLLRQTIRHQSSLEMSQQRLGARRPNGGGTDGRHRLRNASSMSSLLAPHSNSSASVERSPQQQHPKHNQQQQRLHHQQPSNNRLPAGHRYGANQQLRRLMSAQSMANLGGRTTEPAGIAKISAGKFAGGQLAWLPLSSAATVASLSNIGRESEPAEPTSVANPAGRHPIERDGNRCARSRPSGSPVAGKSASRCNQQQLASWCQPAAAAPTKQQQRERLGSIGEHLVDFVSLDERDEKEVDSSSASASKTTDAGNDCLADEEAIKTSSKLSAIETATANSSSKRQQQIMRHAGGCSPSPDDDSSQCQQRRAGGVAIATAATAPAEPRPTEADWPPLYSNQRQQVAARNGLYYAELKRDLRLAQSVILFGQLLNHAPILVSIWC